MKTWRNLFFITLILFIFSSLFFVYTLIDQAYTIGYTKDSYQSLEKENDFLIDLINSKKISKSEITKKIKNLDFGYEIIENSDTFLFYNKSILFTNDSLFHIINPD